MPPSQLAQYALYAASAVNAASVAGHTQMGFEVVLPSLRRLLALTKDGKDDDGTVAARIGWWEVNQVFGVMAILYAKWAKFGVTDNYERSILLLGAAYQFVWGAAYARKGIYPPLLALWLGPGLAVVGGQLL